MKIHHSYSVSRRTLIRWIAFTAAIIAALSALLLNSRVREEDVKRRLQYSYMRAMEDLSSSLDNIKNSLNKGMYSGSSEMASDLSSRLWNDASAAKLLLAQLPVEELNLSSTYKFLSQVGHYSKSLAAKFSAGEELTEEDRENVAKLFEYAKTTSDALWNVESQLQGGYLTFDRILETAQEENSVSETSDENSEALNVTSGFRDIEDGFENYPTLIYDGPFSDHIMQKEPLMLSGLTEVSRADAQNTASLISGIDNLTPAGDESGKMPSFLFSSGDATVSITKAGGYLCYMLDYRAVEDVRLSVDEALNEAVKFLKKAGMGNMTHTYYEIRSGLCIINFAASDNGILCYTDLVKVGVALDDGKVMTFDARGYLTNHQERYLAAPSISAEKAHESVSSSLSCQSVKLCVIPSMGLTEKYCYEFKCKNEEGQQILVYINADTGKEEQILLLQISESGVLTV